ncbi:polycomb-like transcription factor [Holotrichia oblita]|uniref:Polycomb-like transcription factor n=1 Tax=Holotrichia oblita TaxID=644536 RepID=A0ACB9STX2_HOLOL|nr:polycomb-like transcription factor [Holotrichia oblita]
MYVSWKGGAKQQALAPVAPINSTANTVTSSQAQPNASVPNHVANKSNTTTNPPVTNRKSSITTEKPNSSMPVAPTAVPQAPKPVALLTPSPDKPKPNVITPISTYTDPLEQSLARLEHEIIKNESMESISTGMVQVPSIHNNTVGNPNMNCNPNPNPPVLQQSNMVMDIKPPLMADVIPANSMIHGIHPIENEIPSVTANPTSTNMIHSNNNGFGLKHEYDINTNNNGISSVGYPMNMSIQSMFDPIPPHVNNTPPVKKESLHIQPKPIEDLTEPIVPCNATTTITEKKLTPPDLKHSQNYNKQKQQQQHDSNVKNASSWSCLAQPSPPQNNSSASNSNSKQQVMDSFKVFQNKAKEKADREKQRLENLELKRQQKEQAEKERLRVENEKRREKEEEDALEKARKAVAEHNQNISSARVEELRSSPGDGSISPGSQSSGSDRIDRDRQRLREQERRKREALANQIDMNMQSDLMAAFEELDETVVPDSTTIVEKDKLEFAPGQDVLLKQKDGRFYLGTVVEVDAIREQCLVKFGSNWMCKRCIAQEPIRQRKTSDYKILRRDSIRKLCSNVDSSSTMEVRSDVKTLPYNIFNVSKSERRENILSVLTNNRNRFKCGREIKKRTTIWGLRIRLPPPAPCVTLPPVGSISEEELKERWQGNRRLQFLPLEESARSQGDGTLIKIVVLDNHMLNVMMGIAYQENSALSETESPCPSPDGEHEDHLDNKLYKVEYGGGCAKRSVPFPKISLKHKKRLLALNVRTRDKILRRQRRKGKDEVKKRKSNMEYHRPKRLSLDSKSTKNRETLPLTPPTSVSAPPTPPASGSSSLGPDIVTEFTESSNTLISQNLSVLGKHPAKLTKSNLTKNNLDTNLNELNTPCDTSGDETSSKSTLDLIIPPPKDFEGKNNPFLALMRGNVEHLKKRSKDAITLPLPLTAVIPGRPVIRPMKRQLSEKDICIGPNGEVKRRRLRRNRSNQLPIYTNSLQTASKTATVVPVRPDAKEWGQRNLRSTLNQNTSPQSQIGNCVDYALNGRRLRQRQDKSQEKEKISNPPTPKPSPVKQEPDISMDDLKSSVNSYFGAAMRIAAGERFSIKAKRIGPTGRTEYLIEWEGPSNGMT